MLFMEKKKKSSSWVICSRRCALCDIIQIISERNELFWRKIARSRTLELLICISLLYSQRRHPCTDYKVKATTVIN